MSLILYQIGGASGNATAEGPPVTDYKRMIKSNLCLSLLCHHPEPNELVLVQALVMS